MSNEQKKIGILIESDFYEDEIFYYQQRFPEEGFETHFLSRLWGNDEITFEGHEYNAPFTCQNSFENMNEEELTSYDALIVPSGMVADRLRYTENVDELPPASKFMKRAFNHDDIIKGIICHGMWLMSPVSEIIEGRRVTLHNNLIGDAKNYGLEYVDQDLVVDGDLLTARTGDDCNIFARKIIDILSDK